MKEEKRKYWQTVYAISGISWLVLNCIIIYGMVTNTFYFRDNPIMSFFVWVFLGILAAYAEKKRRRYY